MDFIRLEMIRGQWCIHFDMATDSDGNVDGMKPV